MTKYLSAVAVAALFAIPAFAQDAAAPMTKDAAMKVTCTEFTAMDDAAKLNAVQGVDMAMMSDADAATATAAMGTMTDDQKAEAKTKDEANVTKATTACDGKGDMTVMDVMKTAN